MAAFESLTWVAKHLGNINWDTWRTRLTEIHTESYHQKASRNPTLKVFKQNFVLCLSFPCFYIQSSSEIWEQATGSTVSLLHLEHITFTGHLQVSCIAHVQVNYVCTMVICLEILEKWTPFFKLENNCSHVRETKIYGHHGFLIVLENVITTSLSKTATVDINHSQNRICFWNNEATVQRFCATWITYVFR